MTELYTKAFRDIMQVNYDTTSMRSNRVEELMNFAKGAHFKRIGIAHCITFGYEAELLEKYFSKCFDVYTVDCKYGRLQKKDLLGGSGSRILCNPAGQAHFLNQRNTDLNISMGLCVGHDMIFSKASNAFVSNLFDKDFTNNNHPDQAITEIQMKMGL
ncbi:DUF1847 domain-containing protein [Saccharicrinis fermentans]|uniref:Metal-binding protein n=1 Tax=Saccharicrinis fermentans DSM 9555 = JCM 21142 TaxID=869213 RepID=W7Y0T0_9BACT|nr:DUF1847 domain-containing protein [Saccharicrinis fermentans]GAF04535.1 hypothetical protein JCM21142_83243 [Saccharicrinis fermentans DSM 9555 = JCM 21142]